LELLREAEASEETPDDDVSRSSTQDEAENAPAKRVKPDGFIREGPQRRRRRRRRKGKAGKRGRGDNDDGDGDND